MATRRKKVVGLTELITERAAIRKEEARLKQKLEQRRARANEVEAQMKVLVRAGKKSGDPILDHLIASGYGPSPEDQERLRFINAELFGKSGEFVALAYWGKETLRGDRSGENMRRVIIARLQDDTLVLPTDGEPTALPVSSFAKRGLRGGMEIVKKPLTQDQLNVSWMTFQGPEDEDIFHSLGEYEAYVIPGTTRVRRLVNTHLIRASHFDGRKQSIEDLFEKLLKSRK